MKTNKNLWQLGCCLVIAALAMSSCGKKSKWELDFDYVPAQISKGDSWSIIDKNGKEVVKEEYSADAKLSFIDHGAYWVKTDGKFQMFNIDHPKKPLLDEEFTQATRFVSGYAVASRPNQQIRIFDANGKTVATLPKTIKRCYQFSEDGYARFLSSENKYGLLNTKGEVVVKADYAEMKPESDGLVLAQKEYDSKTMLILDTKGKKQGEINIEKYKILSEIFYEGKILVRNADDDKASTIVLDKTGKKLFEIKKSKERKVNGRHYLDGYFVFCNEEGKCGVVDDKGEVVIRAKYDNMLNIGNGSFYAVKGGKMGAVNEKDETILDFEYDDLGITMGENFVVKDGSGWSIIGKDGKELASFDIIDFDVSEYAEFVDVDGLASSLVSKIEGYEQVKTAAQKAQELSLSLDNNHYRSYIEENLNIDGKITSTITIWYEDNIAQEKTHVEQVNDGWFTYNRTVSDGWSWANTLPRRIVGNLTVSNAGVDGSEIYQAVCAKLAQGRTKISDGVYSNYVTVGGKTMECRTSLSQNWNYISLEMTFRR